MATRVGGLAAAGAARTWAGAAATGGRAGVPAVGRAGPAAATFGGAFGRCPGGPAGRGGFAAAGVCEAGIAGGLGRTVLPAGGVAGRNAGAAASSSTSFGSTPHVLNAAPHRGKVFLQPNGLEGSLVRFEFQLIASRQAGPCLQRVASGGLS